MYLEIITPDKKVFEGEVKSVQVPGANGRFQMLNNHAAIISTLVKGQVKIKTSEGEEIVEVNGGVVEMRNNKVIILPEGAA
jgi:F-type H+-transporting ATPase subunit epsilon